MRRIGAVGVLVALMTLLSVVAVDAVTPTTLTWKASGTHLTLHVTSTIKVTSTYTSGKARMTVSTVKKGDVIVFVIEATTTKGKITKFATGRFTALKAGSRTFTLVLSKTQLATLKKDVKAKDALSLHMHDGTRRIIVKYAAV